MLDVAIIIVSWNVRDYLTECLSSVYAELRRSRLRGSVWVVDNGSTDGTLAVLSNLYPSTTVIANEKNAGFGAANNQGMAAAVGCSPRHFLLLNPDTLIRPGALRHLVGCLDDCPEAGMVGARLVYSDGRFQHSAFAFPGVAQIIFDLWPLPARLYESRLNGRYPRRLYRPGAPPFSVDHPLGAAMLVRRDVAERTNGFDESFHIYCEEIDWSWRIRDAGWTIYTVPDAEIVHYGGKSTRQVPASSVVNLWRSRAQLYSKHHSRLTLAVSRRLARAGLRRKASQADDPELRAAYEKAAGFWGAQPVQTAALSQQQAEIGGGEQPTAAD